MVFQWLMRGVSDVEKQRWSQVDMDLLRRLLKDYVAVRPYVFGDGIGGDYLQEEEINWTGNRRNEEKRCETCSIWTENDPDEAYSIMGM